MWVLIPLLILNAVLLGLGCAVGFLLRWIFPAVDLGSAILIGVIVNGFSIHLFLRTLAIPPDSDPEDEETVPRVWVHPMRPPRSRKGKPRRSSP